MEKEEARAGWTAITTIVAALAALFFVGHEFLGMPYERFGVRDAWDIWDGAWFGVPLSALSHGDLIHVAFNLWWLWYLGRPIERALGFGPYLLFLVGAAWVGGGAQLAWSDQTGIGLSGVIYALFGFGWQASARFENLRKYVDRDTVTLLLGWAVLCIVLTRTGTWNIANAAHLAGLAFGVVVAWTTRMPRIAWPATTALVGLAFLVTFWAPWSAAWNGLQADRADDRKDVDAVIFYAGRAVEIDPEYAWAWSMRGWARYEKSEYELALADFEAAVEADPGSTWARQGIGATREQLGQYEEAIAAFIVAIQLDPDDVYSYRRRAWCYEALGRQEDALRDFDEALTRKPDDVDSLLARAWLREELGRTKAALEDLDRALELNPRSAYGFGLRGSIRVDREEYEEAVRDLMRALSLDPENADARDSLAEAYYFSDRFEEAWEVIEEGTGPDAPALRAATLWQLGRHEEAAAAWAKCKPEDRLWETFSELFVD